MARRPVADFTALGAAHAAGFAGGKRRHVVVHDEAVTAFAHDRINNLFVLLGAQGRDDERLSFAAGKEGRTVGARKHALTDFDRTHRAGVAAVDTGLAGEDVAADDLRFHLKENAVHFVHVGHFGAGSFGVLGKRRFHGFVDLTQLIVTVLLAAQRIRGVQAFFSEFTDAGNKRIVLGSRLPVPGGFAGFGNRDHE